MWDKLEQCPVCEGECWHRESNYGEALEIGCPRCGRFVSTIPALSQLFPEDAQERAYRIAVWSYHLRHRTDRDAVLDREYYDEYAEKISLPSPEEQIDNFILLFHQKAKHVSQYVRVHEPEILWRCGLVDHASVEYLVEHFRQLGYITATAVFPDHTAFRLTPAGWQHCAELLRSNPGSNLVFMAMQFGNAELDDAVENVWKPAAKEAGFELRRLDELSKPGVIDNHLRVSIRRARILFVDLSTHNRGAYWEAGFAEGLGRPVLYFCRKDVWDDEKGKPHFDTNHCNTVVWSRDDDAWCRKQIIVNLQNAFPDTANMDVEV